MRLNNILKRRYIPGILMAWLLSCQLKAPVALLDTLGTVSFASGSNLTANSSGYAGELWSGVIFGQVPVAAVGVEIQFDSGAYKQATVSGLTWKISTPTGTEAASGLKRWQVGSRHTLNARSRDGAGNYSAVTTITFVRQANKDFNGDGYADIVVSAHFASKAYIFYGNGNNISSTGAANAGTILSGETGSSQFGQSTAACDINGDGYSDLIVSDTSYNSSQGRTYVFYGSANGIGTLNAASASIIFTGELAADQLGIRITAGDVNGDGYGDIIAGAPNRNAGAGAAQGTVYIFHGSASGLKSIGASAANTILTGETLNNEFGHFLGTGDVNNDGFADVVAGAHFYSASQGRAYIFHGNANGITSAGAAAANTILTGEAGTGEFGTAIATGDINADGFADTIIGALSFGTSAGRAYVFLGTANGVSSVGAAAANTLITGEASNDKFTTRISAGDANCDGYADILVGAQSYSAGANQGRAYLFSGSANGITSQGAGNAATIITGQSANDQFGHATAFSDINGDGCADLLVTAIGYNAGALQGRAYIFKGSSTGISSQGAGNAVTFLTGQSAGDNFGQAVW